MLVVHQSRITGFALDTACNSGPAHGQIVNVADTRRDQCSNEGTGTILKATRIHAKLSLKNAPIDVASFATRTPGKFRKSHSGVASTKPAAFSRPPSLLRCENVVTISGQHLIETRDSGCQTHELSGVTVKISTTRKGCDKIPAPSLTQKFDVTDCVRVQVRESPLWRRICEVIDWQQRLCRSGRGQTYSLLLTSATPFKTFPHLDQK